mmetsp:Transcript_16878/g.34868  ORF Transcript_16878/g.34868 Transcript_16878/m.34868 type:complete len:225 (+) Transcript_16878:1796-2470(+)
MEAMTSSRPLVPASASTLPVHLNLELTLFSRAKALRERGIQSASVEFSFVLAESLVDNLTLLAGDFLFQKGNKVARRVWMLDQGRLEVFGSDGVSIKILYPGDVIGLGWLATRSNESRETAQHKADLDFTSMYGMASSDIRAMADCKLVSGLGSKDQIADLKQMYPLDMSRIQQLCEADTPSSSRAGSVVTRNEDGEEIQKEDTPFDGPSDVSTINSDLALGWS